MTTEGNAVSSQTPASKRSSARMRTSSQSHKTSHSNKNGQELGRKGRETRQRLMDATLELLKEQSPVDLTAVQIARKASMASASFYVYFGDVQDILYAMSEAACQDLVRKFEATELFLDRDNAADDSERFIDFLNAAWSEHQIIFHYRDMEANYGNQRFSSLLTQTAIPMMDRIYALVREGYAEEGGIANIDAYAEAVVLFVSIDQLAASMHRDHANGLPPERLKAAQARILARTLGLTKEARGA